MFARRRPPARSRCWSGKCGSHRSKQSNSSCYEEEQAKNTPQSQVNKCAVWASCDQTLRRSRVRARSRSKGRRSMRAWRCGRHRSGRGRRARSRTRRASACARGNLDCIDTPAFARATVITSHPPTEFAHRLDRRQVYNSRDETARVTTPRLAASDRAISISTDCPIIAATNETSANGKNVLKGISTVSAHFQDTAVKPDIRICRCFKVEVVPE